MMNKMKSPFKFFVAWHVVTTTSVLLLLLLFFPANVWFFPGAHHTPPRVATTSAPWLRVSVPHSTPFWETLAPCWSPLVLLAQGEPQWR